MTENQEQIQILDRNYNISCPAEEKASLHESANLLDKKMREIRSSSKISNVERIAIMAALNIAHDLIKERRSGMSLEVVERLEKISGKISLALDEESK
ncbi:MAG: cell division protein ZapA [Gammaproteobacteria bacterium]|nr:cell division protein ZapA [Gammaproteobacteria bacterium]